MDRKAYPTDVSDDEWAFVAPYLTLMTEEAPQREHSLREVFNGLRWLSRSGSAWRLIPHDLPPWAAVYQQTQRWFKAGVFEAIVDDLRALLRLAAGRNEQPSAVILDSRTLQSTPESGGRALHNRSMNFGQRLCNVRVVSLPISVKTERNKVNRITSAATVVVNSLRFMSRKATQMKSNENVWKCTSMVWDFVRLNESRRCIILQALTG